MPAPQSGLPAALMARLPFFYGWIILGCVCCAGFARNGADHDGAVVNFRNLGLEQMLHQLRSGARNHDRRTF